MPVKIANYNDMVRVNAAKEVPRAHRLRTENLVNTQLLVCASVSVDGPRAHSRAGESKKKRTTR